MNKKRPSLVARAMCEECNTGWMAGIESDALPIVSALIRGDEPSLISLDDQVKMARWLALKAIVERYVSSPTRWINPAWVKHVADTHQPPPSWVILIGRYQGNHPLFLSSRVGEWTVFMPTPLVHFPENVLLTMLGVGNFAAQIIGTSWPVPVAFDANRLVQIWPQPSTGNNRAALTGSPDVQWPTAAWIDDRDIVTMSDFPGGID